VGYTHYKPGLRFDDTQEELRSAYEASRGKSRVKWEDARTAAERAWRRAERAEASRAQDGEEH
jgi:hypothetical protein